MQYLNRITDSFIYWLAKLAVLLDTLVFKMVKWRSRNEVEEIEADPRDQAERPEAMEITLREVDLGDFQVECPECGERDNAVLMGLGLNQDQENTEGDHYDITTVGMVAYPCGDIMYSPCLTDKVARILNACETQTLRLEMFTGLLMCEVHGVSYTDE